MEARLPSLFRRQTRTLLLETIKRKMNEDGSIESISSPSPDIPLYFEKTITILSAALALYSLNTADCYDQDIQFIKNRATGFLLKRKGSDATWNYFADRNDYSDDLDDTALAYLALHSYDKKLFTPEDAHAFALALIQSEVKEGGPYTTWLNPNYPKEVDVVVNINIARALQVHDIVLPSLAKLIDNAIKNKNFKSMYYVSPLFTCYFLSFIKNLSEKQKESAIKYIFLLQKKQGNKICLWENILQSALAVNALINLGASHEKIVKIIDKLRKSVEKQLETIGLKEEAICLDPAVGRKQMYMGSKAVTAALLLEINKYRHAILLKRFYDECWKMNFDISGLTDCLIPEFTDIIFGFSESLKKKNLLDEWELTEISIAHLFGVLAYDIFDNVYDEKKSTDNLPLALDLLREMYSRLEKLRFKKSIIDMFVKETNKGMIEEKSDTKSDALYPGRKSIGFALPCFLIISRFGIAPKHTDWKDLHRFFLHFLTARALHDDILDYEKDLKCGHPNSIADLIKRYPNTDKEKLARSHIRNHLTIAQDHLNNISILNPDNYLHNLLKGLSL